MRCPKILSLTLLLLASLAWVFWDTKWPTDDALLRFTMAFAILMTLSHFVKMKRRIPARADRWLLALTVAHIFSYYDISAALGSWTAKLISAGILGAYYLSIRSALQVPVNQR